MSGGLVEKSSMIKSQVYAIHTNANESYWIIEMRYFLLYMERSIGHNRVAVKHGNHKNMMMGNLG